MRYPSKFKTMAESEYSSGYIMWAVIDDTMKKLSADLAVNQHVRMEEKIRNEELKSERK